MKQLKLLFLTTTLIFSSLLFAADGGGGSKEGAGGEAETQLLDGKGKSLKEEDTCPICLEEHKEEARVSPCGHIFCLECLKEVAKISKQCPLCRGELRNIIPISVQQGGEAASTLPVVQITPELYLAQQRVVMAKLYQLLPDGDKVAALARLERFPIGWKGVVNWEGVVKVSPDGFILKLDLSNYQLTGEIPRELGQLTELQELWLSENQLTGPIPSELGRLTQLQHLDLCFNGLTGEIPRELARLTELQYLYLHHNQLTGPTPPELIRKGLTVFR